MKLILCSAVALCAFVKSQDQAAENPALRANIEDVEEPEPVHLIILATCSKSLNSSPCNFIRSCYFLDRPAVTKYCGTVCEQAVGQDFGSYDRKCSNVLRKIPKKDR